MRNFLTIIAVFGLGLFYISTNQNKDIQIAFADDDDPANGIVQAIDANDPSRPPSTDTVVIPSGATYIILTVGKGLGGGPGWDGIAYKVNSDGTFAFKAYDNLKFGGTGSLIKPGAGCHLTIPQFRAESQRYVSCTP